MIKKKTSLFWWIGMGFFLKYNAGEFHLRKGHRSVYVNKSDLKAVRVERRALRGWTLVVDTHTKPIYFRANHRGARMAKLWIESNATHAGATL